MRRSGCGWAPRLDRAHEHDVSNDDETRSDPARTPAEAPSPQRPASLPPPDARSSPGDAAAPSGTGGTRNTGLGRAALGSQHVGDLRRARPVLLFAVITWPLFVLIDLAHLASGGAGDLATLLLLRALPMPWFLYALARVRRRPTISLREFTFLLYGTVFLLMVTLTLEAAVTGGMRSLFAESTLVVLAGTTIVPRPARKHAWPMIGAALVYPIGMTIGALAYAPMRGQLSDRDALYHFGAHVSLIFTTTAIVVLASNRLFQLRRSIAESHSIGRYALRRRIGKGGMGEVWAAWHRGLEREVALKILRIGDETDEVAAARFEREVRLSSGLTHPNTVRVFDSGRTEDGLLYYAMELLEGASLGELVKREGPMPPARAVYLVTHAARALAEAHDAGIVHRDVKPENLFVTSAGGEGDFVKVLDFGIARSASEQASHLTQTGAVAGTPATMSPEVITGGAATAASDVYGLGAVLYFALTGRPPFKGDSPGATLLAHLNDAPVPPSERQRGVPPDVDAIVARALAKKPEDRFPDGRALAEALARCSVASAWTPAPVTDLPRARALPPPSTPPPPNEADTRVEVRRHTG
ncbi:MAG: serine/threonine-protein kinase [Sandaracinus sp.]